MEVVSSGPCRDLLRSVDLRPWVMLGEVMGFGARRDRFCRGSCEVD